MVPAPDGCDDIVVVGKISQSPPPSELPMLPNNFETARLVLRPVTVVDADAIFDTYAQDEKVVRYLKWRPHRSRSETQTFVERCIATPADVERTYMLVGRVDNIARGAFSLRQWLAAMCWYDDGGGRA